MLDANGNRPAIAAYSYNKLALREIGGLVAMPILDPPFLKA
jgi:hypothetical protein